MKETKQTGKEVKPNARKMRGVKLSDEAVANFFAYGAKNHISGGLSGALEYLAFNLDASNENTKS